MKRSEAIDKMARYSLGFFENEEINSKWKKEFEDKKELMHNLLTLLEAEGVSPPVYRRRITVFQAKFCQCCYADEEGLYILERDWEPEDEKK